MKRNIIERYLTVFDEIDRLISTSYYLASNMDDPEKRAEQVVDDALSMLIRAYREGVDAVSEMLEYELAAGTTGMQQSIFASVDGKTFEDRIREYVQAEDHTGVETTILTESHRVYNAGAWDAADQYRQATGKRVEKLWLTVRDGRVRETHSYLEGMAVDLDNDFYTFDGDHASYPGGFSKAKNNVNCRCIVEYRVKS